AGYIVTNQHVVERAADLRTQVTTNDGKTHNTHYITDDDKTNLAFIKIDAKADIPFISIDNISQKLLGYMVIVDSNAHSHGHRSKNHRVKHRHQMPSACLECKCRI